MSIPLRSGRYFAVSDQTKTMPVIVVDELLAKKYFEGQDPIGKRLNVSGEQLATIVGVVGHVRNNALEDVGEPQIYLPFSQHVLSFLSFTVRTSSDPLILLPAIRENIRKMDSEIPIAKIQPMQNMVQAALAQRRFYMLLLLIFGACAVLLSAIGIYGLISYVISQRTQEFGIRMALGARQGNIVLLVLRRSLILAITGLAIGVLASLGATRVLSSLLYEVSPLDPVTFVEVSVFLLAVILLACYLPARRASKLNPLRALRYQS
jgi:putative ABC transport system permease protein